MLLLRNDFGRVHSKCITSDCLFPSPECSIAIENEKRAVDENFPNILCNAH